MELHRRRVDARLERVVGVGQVRQRVGVGLGGRGRRSGAGSTNKETAVLGHRHGGHLAQRSRREGEGNDDLHGCDSRAERRSEMLPIARSRGEAGLGGGHEGPGNESASSASRPAPLSGPPQNEVSRPETTRASAPDKPSALAIYINSIGISRGPKPSPARPNRKKEPTNRARLPRDAAAVTTPGLSP